MIRECSLSDISNGKTYELNDMVKTDTAGCAGCFKCCTGMGTSIVLDPYDICNLKKKFGLGFQELIAKGYIELNLFEGVIMPNLPMSNNDGCVFLLDGRCSIHDSRPGLCKIFPLGRVYDRENKNFKYFLQDDQCIKNSRSKIKVKKWISVDNIEKNQEFISAWHFFVRAVSEKVYKMRENGRGEMVNDIAMYVLNEFYVKDIVFEDFFDVIFDKINEAKKGLELEDKK